MSGLDVQRPQPNIDEDADQKSGTAKQRATEKLTEEDREQAADLPINLATALDYMTQGVVAPLPTCRESQRLDTTLKRSGTSDTQQEIVGQIFTENDAPLSASKLGKQSHSKETTLTVRPANYKDARRQRLIFQPQDLSIERWRLFRCKAMASQLYPSSLSRLKCEYLSCFAVDQVLTPFFNISRLDRWQGVGLVFILRWQTWMVKCISTIPSPAYSPFIFVLLVEAEMQKDEEGNGNREREGSGYEEHGMSCAQTDELLTTGRLEMPLKNCWPSKVRIHPPALIGSWAGVGIVEIFRDKEIEKVVIEVIWKGKLQRRGIEYVGPQTEMDWIRKAQARLDHLLKDHQVEAPVRANQLALKPLPSRFYLKGVGIIESRYFDEKEIMRVEIIEAQDPLKMTRDRGRKHHKNGKPGQSSANMVGGVYEIDAEPEDVQREDLEAEEDLRPDFGWRLILALDLRVREEPLKGTFEEETDFEFDTVVTPTNLRELRRNLWWLLGKTPSLLSFIESPRHRLKLQVCGDGPYGAQILTKLPNSNIAHEEVLSVQDASDSLSRTRPSAAKSFNMSHRGNGADDLNSNRGFYKIAPFEEFWFTLCMQSKPSRPFRLLRKQYEDLRRNGALLLSVGPEMASSVSYMFVHWHRIGWVSIHGCGRDGLAFLIRNVERQWEEDMDELKERGRVLEFRFEGMPWFG